MKRIFEGHFSKIREGIASFVSWVLREEAAEGAESEAVTSAYSLMQQEQETLSQISDTINILEKSISMSEDDAKQKVELERQRAIFQDSKSATELALKHAELNYAVVQEALPDDILKLKQEVDELKINLAMGAPDEWVRPYLLKIREYEHALEVHRKKQAILNRTKERRQRNAG